MSSNESLEDFKQKTLSSQDFMQFLSRQSISKLTLSATLDNGKKISASFNELVSGNDPSVFKSIDLLKSLNSQESVAMKAPTASVISDCGGSSSSSAEPKDSAAAFASTDWQTEYAKSHIDVTYTNCFNPKSQQDAARLPAAGATLPPKKRAGKYDWQGMFQNALSPLVTAASIVQPQPLDKSSKPFNLSNLSDASNISNEPPSQPPSNKQAKQMAKQSKRKPRKIVPANKEYVDVYKETDILFGRGGRSNHHPGNKLYRDIVTEKQPYYRRCEKNEKTKVAQGIVDNIQNRHNGRFLELDKETGRWYVVPNIVARRKVGQALRENNTEEARAAKREKYGQVKQSKEFIDNVHDVL